MYFVPFVSVIRLIGNAVRARIFMACYKGYTPILLAFMSLEPSYLVTLCMPVSSADNLCKLF